MELQAIATGKKSDSEDAGNWDFANQIVAGQYEIICPWCESTCQHFEISEEVLQCPTCSKLFVMDMEGAREMNNQRWQLVPEPPNFEAKCLSCKKESVGEKWADLNGLPFKAYYCVPCRDKLV